ncbi:uncharacterized protein METZ01_LOCUS222961, partial [marine metagenome]
VVAAAQKSADQPLLLEAGCVGQASSRTRRIFRIIGRSLPEALLLRVLRLKASRACALGRPGGAHLGTAHHLHRELKAEEIF